MVLIAVLVCLAVAMLLVGAGVKTIGLERRAVRDQENRLQAGWLAESGLERAAGSLKTNENYEGETWQIGADELGGRAAAQVLIRVERSTETPRRRTVHVQADFPANQENRARRSKDLPVDLPL